MSAFAKLIRGIKLRIVLGLLGPLPDLDAHVEEVYQAIWPKHDAYEVETRETLKKALLRERLQNDKKTL